MAKRFNPLLNDGIDDIGLPVPTVINTSEDVVIPNIPGFYQVYVNASFGNITVTLPDASSSFAGSLVSVTKIDNSANNVTLSQVNGSTTTITSPSASKKCSV